MNTRDASDLRRLLGLSPEDAPVFTVPPLVKGDDGHFRAGWATLLLRKGDVPARLLLPGPNREARRVSRFAASCNEEAAIVIAPAAAGQSPLEILAAANVLVIPSAGLYDPDTVTRAMCMRLPIVAVGEHPPLLAAETCVISAGPEPLNLARSMLRIWQDRSLAEAVAAAAAERVAQVHAAG